MVKDELIATSIVNFRVGRKNVPAIIAVEGERAKQRWTEFFTAEIRNANTRAAYARATGRFCDWCERYKLRLVDLKPVHVATYVEALGRELQKPSVKQHLAAIKMLFDYLVVGQVLQSNPAASVRGPKYVIKKGKTPVLGSGDMRTLFASLPTDKLSGLRDRALIGVMAYSFARIGAVLAMDIDDCVLRGRRLWLRLHEKGGRHHEVPVHHTLEEYLDAYMEAAGMVGNHGPLFRRLDRKGGLSPNRLSRREALAMVKRRALAAGHGNEVCNHSFRASGITNYLENGGTIEKAQAIAAHESPRTTKLYDRTQDELSLDEIERIQF